MWIVYVYPFFFIFIIINYNLNVETFAAKPKKIEKKKSY